MAFETQAAAQDVLEISRSTTLSIARETAVRILQSNENTPIDTRIVRTVMVQDGTYVDHGSDAWLGGLFARDPKRRFKRVPRITPLCAAHYTDSNHQTGRSSHGGGEFGAGCWVLA